MNYIIVMDYSTGSLIKIKLTEEEKKEFAATDDSEAFVDELSVKYGFRMQDSYWMSVDVLQEYNYNL
ncbi:MAG: hypothetical protein H9802_15475 [Candidatus Phocaeicola faecipullorum]|nr:hypothetical protein [Candidatus Phocaeicola faecipullorum]